MGRRKGRRHGKRHGKGRKEGVEKLIGKMLQKGKTVESIADDTDIPVSNILSVQKRMLINA